RVRSATRTLPAGSGFERREFLGLFIKVGVAAFAYSLSGGLGRASAAGNSACAHFCDAIFPPGPERGKCKSDGAHGVGICFEGPCVPAVAGHKPKTDPQTKLATLAANNPVPSVLGAAMFQMARRFLLGRTPANEIEASAFAIFGGLSSTLQEVLACS